MGIRFIRGVPGLLPLHQVVVDLVVELLEVQPVTPRRDPPTGSQAGLAHRCGTPPFHTKHINLRTPPGRLESQLHRRLLFLFKSCLYNVCFVRVNYHSQVAHDSNPELSGGPKHSTGSTWIICPRQAGRDHEGRDRGVKALQQASSNSEGSCPNSNNKNKSINDTTTIMSSTIMI